MAKRKTKPKPKKKPKRTLRKNRKVQAAPVFKRTAAPVAETIRVPRPKPPVQTRRTKAQVEMIIADAYKVVFTSAAGEIVKADIMQWCNVYNPVTETDPINLGMRMGERNVALRIAQMLGLRPEHFPVEAWKAADEINAMAGA